MTLEDRKKKMEETERRLLTEELIKDVKAIKVSVNDKAQELLDKFESVMEKHGIEFHSEDGNICHDLLGFPTNPKWIVALRMFCYGFPKGADFRPFLSFGPMIIDSDYPDPSPREKSIL